MAIAPFRIAPPKHVAVEVSLAPVLNALTSLSLLHVVAPLPGADPWVAQTAARLTPEQHRRNRLVFEGLGEALLPERDWPDFAAYLADLAAQDPLALRDRMLARLARPPVEPAQLLADGEAFLTHLERLYGDDPPDRSLAAEVHRLLNDPPALQALVVSHLSELWNSALAEEWHRRLPLLTWLSQRLMRRTWPAATAAEAIRSFLGRDLPPAISAQLDGVQRVVFVLSPHVGPWASRLASDDTIWVFVRDHPEELPLRQAPVKRIELIGPLSALADETRLRILELLAQRGELSAQEIITHLDLSQSNISRHLKQLSATGFVAERRGEGANKHYHLSPARVDWTFRALVELLAGEGAPSPAEGVLPDQPEELRRFLDAEGRITRWTKKRRDQLLLLDYLVSQFALEREYSEAEVNAILNRWHTFADPAALRRALYDERLLDRTPDGARYWRRPEHV